MDDPIWVTLWDWLDNVDSRVRFFPLSQTRSIQLFTVFSTRNVRRCVTNNYLINKRQKLRFSFAQTFDNALTSIFISVSVSLLSFSFVPVSPWNEPHCQSSFTFNHDRKKIQSNPSSSLYPFPTFKSLKFSYSRSKSPRGKNAAYSSKNARRKNKGKGN